MKTHLLRDMFIVGSATLALAAESVIPGQSMDVGVNGTSVWSGPVGRGNGASTPERRRSIEFTGVQGLNLITISFADYNRKTTPYAPRDTRLLAAAFAEMTLKRASPP